MEEELTDKKSPMRYITRVRLENFQSHKDTDIDLTSGINLIVGSSDAGKSSIMRAINFVFHNQPRNKSFIRMGANEARVTVWFSDGTEIQRIKGDRNCIVITKIGEQPQVFEKIGHELPPEAIEALGNPPIDEKHGPLSFSEQMAPYFLVALSPTELPRSISELTGISHFEEAAQILGKQARQADRQAKETQGRLDDYENELEAYVDLDNQLEKLDVLETKATKAQDILNQIDVTEHLQGKYNLVMSTGRKTSKKLKKSKAVAACEPTLLKILSLENKIEDLGILHCDYLDNIDAEKKGQRKIEMLRSIASKQVVTKIEQTKELSKKIDSLNSLLNNYNKLIIKGKKAKQQHDKWQQFIGELTANYNNLVEEVKKTGEWCDICERPAVKGKKCKHSGKAKK